ncbi:hypothetical protein CO053_02945 [Candidatus Shapirobacteria bacterium CG_4_9_14_0_2_um_filter_40_11]|uniref:Uncharacterized protein n=1 Tax=Candidatus Shapirobacteria bacterium CG_4_9_14_0_2_um_filter_40_11 TaxID=1974876 RepID=A0A2M8EUG5_9BACT|nr:MAG: hypothetical protein CO053_02945 [Candidatus Shapirobacteria bacterium CG_4_9_14_0_2_um_filter_40_11]
MPTGRKVCLSFIITFLFCFPFALGKKYFISKHAKVLPLERQSKTVPNVVARVGEYQIGILSGWTSPYAEVYLNGQGTARKTAADENGYFEFFMVPVKKSYGELCLTSQDINLVPTLPVCLPAIPPTDNAEVIGVLLPPTISLERTKIHLGESTKASGMTFPDSEVDVYLFENYNNYNFHNIHNKLFSVFAAGLPKYSIRSNTNGYFEFSLPTSDPSENRLFAVSYLSNLSFPSYLGVFPSPKSNTLSLQVFKPNWLWLILLVLSILSVLSLLRKRKPHALLIPQNDLVKSPAFYDTSLGDL